MRPDIINRIESKEIKAYFNSEIAEIREKSITINTESKEIEIQNVFQIIRFLMKLKLVITIKRFLKVKRTKCEDKATGKPNV